MCTLLWQIGARRDSATLDIRRTLSEALLHHQAGHLAEAERLYQVILRDFPSQPDALHLLGVLTHQRGDAAAAETLIRRALAINPKAPMFHNNLGKALEDLGDRAGAITSYRRALSLAPDYGEAHYNLGVALQADGDYAAAEAAYRRAWELDPRHYKAAHNLGVALLGQGRPGDAVSVLRRAVDLRPDEANTGRTLLQALLYDPQLDEASRFAEHERYAAKFAPPTLSPVDPHANSRDRLRRLRIGWVSSDFRDHPVARNLEPIFVHLDRAQFETICYADVPTPDAKTAVFQSLADVWRSIAGRTDREAAELIRSDKIDILVILAGHFDRNRPLIAAYRPAPVQVAFNDQATSGLTALDYLIADRTVAPRHTSERFTERVLRLPSFYVHAPLADAPAVTRPPSVESGYATFGSFNNPAKINDRVLESWAAVMQAVPASRLRLSYRNRFAPLRSRLLAILAAKGISGDRLETGDKALSYETHLSRYGLIDVALDPFPYSGSTTTFEALWMGVPVITLAGANMVSRWSASMLHALGLDELIADTADDYVRKAVALAREPGRLYDLRATLRARVAASPLCDGQHRSRQIERLFRAIWCRWCAGRAT